MSSISPNTGEFEFVPTLSSASEDWILHFDSDGPGDLGGNPGETPRKQSIVDFVAEHVATPVGSIIYVDSAHSGATDTRTDLSPYTDTKPFVTVVAAVAAAASGDAICILDTAVDESDVQITDKDLVIFSGVGRTTYEHSGYAGPFALSSSTGNTLTLVGMDFDFASSPLAYPVTLVGTDSHVVLKNCEIVGTGRPPVTFNSANQSAKFVGVHAEGVVSSWSVNGILTIDGNSSLVGNLGGSGVLNLDSGAVVDGNITTTTVNYPDDGVSYFDEIRTDNIQETTVGGGVAIENINITDNLLTGVNTGHTIYVNPQHTGAQDAPRTGVGAYDPNRPFETIQAAVSAAKTTDIIFIANNVNTFYGENIVIPNGFSITLAADQPHQTVDVLGSITVSGAGTINLLGVGFLLGLVNGGGTTVMAWGCSFGFTGSPSLTLTGTTPSVSLFKCTVVGNDSDLGTSGIIHAHLGTQINTNIIGTGTYAQYGGNSHDGTISGTVTQTFLNDSVVYFPNITVGGGVAAGIEEKTSDYPITADDYTILVDASSNTVEITLLAAPSKGQIFNIKCVADTFAATINTNGQEVDGSTSTINLALGDNVKLQADSTGNYHIL